MKLISLLFLGLMVALASPMAQTKVDLKTENDKVSYAIGMDIGSKLTQQGLKLSPKLLTKGLSDAMNGGKTLLTDAEAKEVLVAFQMEMRKKQMAKQKVKGATNKKEGEAFLAKNKTKKGVITTASGLQYKVIKKGSGKKPTASNQVVAHYKGTLINGKEFDSSHKRGTPVTFGVTGVIKGWTEVLQLMKEGAKYMVYIPSALAYGERGAGKMIGPDSTLIFEIELIEVK